MEKPTLKARDMEALAYVFDAAAPRRRLRPLRLRPRPLIAATVLLAAGAFVALLLAVR